MKLLLIMHGPFCSREHGSPHCYSLNSEVSAKCGRSFSAPLHFDPLSDKQCGAKVCNQVSTYENILDNFCQADFGEREKIEGQLSLM